MIDFLKIMNFQSHENSQLHFSSGVNVIIGPSDSGKTSILRALRWATDNKPAGFSFHSRFAKESYTEVFLQAGDYDINIYKDSTVNLYTLSLEDFVAFGQDVPDQIKNALNLTEINTQYQHDAPFLLSESPGVVARFLNQIVNLDKIDSSLKNITSLHRQTNQEIIRTQDRIKELDIHINSFPDLDALLSKVVKLESYQQEKDNSLKISKQLEQLLQEINQCETKFHAIIIPDINFTKIERLINYRRKLIYTVEQLTILVSNIIRKQKSLSDCDEELRKWEMKFIQLVPTSCPFCGSVITEEKKLGILGLSTFVGCLVAGWQSNRIHLQPRWQRRGLCDES